MSGPDGVHPLTLLKIYQTTVLPKALFGCELWQPISASSLSQLEIAHHFCVKSAQSLPTRTRSDMALGLLGTQSIEAYIDTQKLRFLGTLCNAPPNSMVSTVFLYRCFQWRHSTTPVHHGFVPDTVSILEKYGLTDFLIRFLEEGVFPAQNRWKRVFKKHVTAYERHCWSERLKVSEDFRFFRSVHTELVPSNIWRVAKGKPSSLHFFKHLVRLCCTIHIVYEVACHHCGALCENIVEHLIFECSSDTKSARRLAFLVGILQHFGPVIYDCMFTSSRSNTKRYLFGHVDNALAAVLNPDIYHELLTVCAKFVYYMSK